MQQSKPNGVIGTVYLENMASNLQEQSKINQMKNTLESDTTKVQKVMKATQAKKVKSKTISSKNKKNTGVKMKDYNHTVRIASVFLKANNLFGFLAIRHIFSPTQTRISK